jgi:phage major head subunit gpT-like protein
MGIDITYEQLDDFRRTLSSAFFGALASQPPAEYAQFCSTFPAASTRNIYAFLGELPSMREWIGPRIARQISNHRYQIENRKFELTFTVKRDELEDDLAGQLAMYSGLSAMHARAVAVHPDELMFQEIWANGHVNPCYDGQNFFDDSHPVGRADLGTLTTSADYCKNDMGGSGVAWYLLDLSKPIKPFIYQPRRAAEFTQIVSPSAEHVFKHDEYMYGSSIRDNGGYGMWQCAIKSKQTLNYDNLKAAILRMQSFQNDEGRNLGLGKNPMLVVPRGEIQFTARDLLDAQYDGSTTSTRDNRARGLVQYFVSNYLPVG